jgi:hypothetical protein
MTLTFTSGSLFSSVPLWYASLLINDPDDLLGMAHSAIKRALE